jgi:hypothetical protein
VCHALAFYSIRYLHFPYKVFSSRTIYRAGECLPRAIKKKYGLTGEKEMRLFICGSYADASDRAVFSAAVNKYRNKFTFFHFLPFSL